MVGVTDRPLLPVGDHREARRASRGSPTGAAGEDPHEQRDEEPSRIGSRERAAIAGRRGPACGPVAADELADALKGLDPEQITGPGGLLTQLAGRVIETALESELTGHLGYPPGQAPPGRAGNHRNGSTPKTVKTELGEVTIKNPRDRAGTFEPQLVGKHQTRLAGLDEKIIGLYAGGMSVRDIEGHLQDLYGVKIGRDTMSPSPTRSSRTSRRGEHGRWSGYTRSRISTA